MGGSLRGMAFVLVASVSLVLQVAPAGATTTLRVDPLIQGAFLGVPPLPGSPNGFLSISNASTGGSTATVTSLRLTPSCGSLTPSPSLTCSAPDRGVFAIQDLGPYDGGGSCGGKTFTATESDPATGELTISPSSPIALPDSGYCSLSYDAVALRLPTVDVDPVRQYRQTAVLARATATSAESPGGVAGFGASPADVYPPDLPAVDCGVRMRARKGRRRIHPVLTGLKGSTRCEVGKPVVKGWVAKCLPLRHRACAPVGKRTPKALRGFSCEIHFPKKASSRSRRKRRKLTQRDSVGCTRLNQYQELVLEVVFALRPSEVLFARNFKKNDARDKQQDGG